MLAIIKKNILLVMLGFIVTLSASAQQSLLKMAEHHYDNLSYVRAIEAYEQALTKKNIEPDDARSARIKLADSYTKLKDNGNAERVFAELFSSGAELPDTESMVYLKYAQVLASNGKYQESQTMYDTYTQKAQNDPRGQGFSKLYNDVSVLSKNASCYNVDYLSINTTASDFSPSYFRNGLVFVSNRKNTSGVSRVFQWSETPFLDLFFLEDLAELGSNSSAGLGGSSSANNSSKNSKKKRTGVVGDDEYTSPTANDSKTIGSFGGTSISAGHGYGDSPETESERLSGSINSKYHEGPSAFFKDGQRVIFTRNNFVKGKAEKSSDGINKLKLYIANADKKGWADIAELPFNSDEYSTGHPTLSPNEDYLFFASDMPGGYGGTDIYAAKIDNGNWSQPINLGPEINTKGNEMFPYVDENGNLYFSSEGLPGLGGLDIFFVQLNATKVQGAPINLGTPINSSNDDFGMLTDGLRKSGYFSSNRKRGGDDDDIYKFERECEIQEGCDLILAVYDAETKMPLDNVTIKYTDASGNIQEAMTDEDGSLTLKNLSQNTEYTFSASRDGYNANIVSLTTENCDNEPSRLEIPMTPPVPANQQDGIAKNNNGKGVQGPTSGLSESGFSNNKTCIIKGRVLMQNTDKPMAGVLVSLKNECDASTQTAYTDESGYYEFTVAEGCDYTLTGAKSNLASQDKTVSKLSCADGGVTANVFMFGSGDIVEIENIYFDYGKHNIRADAREGIDKLVKVMREHPGMKIALASHTDSRSPKDFNQKLSEGRASESAEYLFKRGISRSRVTFAGYGESKILNGCVDGVKCTEAQHQKNRRTEFEIVQMN